MIGVRPARAGRLKVNSPHERRHPDCASRFRTPTLMTRFSPRSRMLVLGALLLVGAAALWYATNRHASPPPPEQTSDAPSDLSPDPLPPDPRLTFPTTFRNVKPDVQYVGDARCAECHGDICMTYRNHPMGRSAEFIRPSAVIEKFDGSANSPLQIGVYELRVAKTPDRVVHRLSAKDSTGNPLPDYVVQANIAIGSGARGRSYLWMEEGAVWQSPVSWFSEEAQWKLFPGFHSRTGGAWPAHADCLFCHVDRVEPVRGTLNRYREPVFPLQAAIGCERCHGPGALHVAERSANVLAEKIDTSIVNPRHLPPELQASVCAQCHLEGQERVARRGRHVFEFRPGLPFELFVTVFVRHPDLTDGLHSGGQFEQIERSRCFTSSGGRLSCTSCHDPHLAPAPAARASFYRDRCLACHESKGCTAPQSDRTLKGDSCVACHMPRGDSANLAHVSVADHRILRRPTAPLSGRTLAPVDVPLVAFRTGAYAPPPEERERDLGIAFSRLTTKIPLTAPAVKERMATLAIDRLTASLEKWRGDADAWVGMSVARGARGEGGEWLTAATNAATLDPNSEAALTEQASAALATGRFDVAAEVAARLIQLNPSAVEHRLTWATALVRQGEWGKAEEALRTILGRNPLHVQARLLLAVCRHHLGDAAGGRREAETAAGLITDPRQRQMLLDRYRRDTLTPK